MSSDALAARLLATFLDELDEQVRALNADLLALEAQPTDSDRLRSIFRVAHTLKGAASAANVPEVEQLCHDLETMLADAREGRAPLGAEQFSQLFAAADTLAGIAGRLRGRRDSGLGTRDSAPPLPSPESRIPTPDLRPPTRPPAAWADGEGSIRVRADKLEAMFATAAQLLIGAGRARSAAQDLESLREFAARWATEWRRSSSGLRTALGRSAPSAAAMGALDAMEQKLQELTRETSRLAMSATKEARTLSLISDDLMERVRSVRMRPFAEACEALPRVVHDLAAETGKEAELVIEGGDVEADRVILDGLREALVHLVRNAVDHGLEPSEERERHGKPRRGTVTVAAVLRGDSILVTVSDDGAGLDRSAVSAELEARGRVTPEDDRALARVLFEEGFSTRSEASAISGRGVGLDVVETAVQRIRGSVDADWTEGRGMAFTLSAPLSLATVRALLVSVGGQIIAIPTGAVRRLMRARLDDLRRIDDRHVLPTPEGPLPLAALARLLGPPIVEQPVAGDIPIVILAAGRRRLAAAVDALLEEDQLVVRPLERIGRPIPQLIGAALLSTGRVALVVNPAVLTSGATVRAAGAGISFVERVREAPARHRVLVVDDSITTRTLEQSVLEAAGFDVLTASDGEDAWRLLQERGSDLVLTDIEMPRMDGFALTETIRASERFRTLPVVLVTAMEAPEHRTRGLEAGADAYIVKSSFDQEALLETIRQLLR